MSAEELKDRRSRSRDDSQTMGAFWRPRRELQGVQIRFGRAESDVAMNCFNMPSGPRMIIGGHALIDRSTRTMFRICIDLFAVHLDERRCRRQTLLHLRHRHHDGLNSSTKQRSLESVNFAPCQECCVSASERLPPKRDREEPHATEPQ